MIRINLLPPEMRRLEHTPPARKYTIFLGTFFAAIAVVGLVYVYELIREVNDEIGTLEGQKAQAKLAIAEYDSVKAERTKYQARKDAVEAIKAKRKFRWSKQLDTLADVVDANPRLWLSGIKFSEGAPSEKLPSSLANRTVEYYLQMRDSRTSTPDKTLYRELERVLMQKFVDSGQFGYLYPPTTITMEKQDKFVEGFSHKFNVLLLGLGAAKAPGPGLPPGGGS